MMVFLYCRRYAADVLGADAEMNHSYLRAGTEGDTSCKATRDGTCTANSSKHGIKPAKSSVNETSGRKLHSTLKSSCFEDL